ncbi:MAG: gene transfer agent family protein [Hyphomicrobiales bacterium]|nr:gene transfer agent family protein [Hyphomicrobiales bacterium]MDE2113803.1 gene transfer agent family protein [Hyphomicrobiales bacterium]
MTNQHRGEISACFGGVEYTLCLTLGALAELETAFGSKTLAGIAGRFEAGNLSAQDIVVILGCGLRGAGHRLTNDQVAQLKVDGGLPAYVQIAAQLLRATFGGSDPENPRLPQKA